MAVEREINALCKQRWNGRWQPCEPFQYGWIRDWVLRPDVAARDDAENFWKILKVINTQQWSKEKDFTCPRWTAKKLRSARMPMDLPPLKPIRVRHDPFTKEESGWPKELPVSLKKWFYYHGVNAPFCNCFRGGHYRPAHYMFRTPWMFELRTRPAIISRLPMIDGDLESKLDRLNNHMRAHQYWAVLRHERGHPRNARLDERPRLITRQLDKETSEEVKDINL